MEDLRHKKELEKLKWERKIHSIIRFFSKYRYKILILLILSVIIIFPEFSGQIIGQFITDFLGTLIKFINL